MTGLHESIMNFDKVNISFLLYDMYISQYLISFKK